MNVIYTWNIIVLSLTIICKLLVQIRCSKFVLIVSHWLLLELWENCFKIFLHIFFESKVGNAQLIYILNTCHSLPRGHFIWKLLFQACSNWSNFNSICNNIKLHSSLSDWTHYGRYNLTTKYIFILDISQKLWPVHNVLYLYARKSLSFNYQ